MDWTAGYVTEIEYLCNYNRVLCPSVLRLVCLSAGLAPPAGEPLRYLELGYGQGLSLNIHAAACAGEFWGTDFNPSHVAHARALGEAAGSGVRLLDASFTELAARQDLPEFDIVALHGIWSWVSDENRGVIIDLIRRKLRVGGIVYIAYNCFPGYAPILPLRHLMKLHADLAGNANGIVAKVDGALAFTQQVIDSGALYFRRHPAVGEWLKTITAENRSYLAHEYLNEHWGVMTFSDVVRWLDQAKLTFIASAQLLDHVEAVNLSVEGQHLLAEIKNPILQQSVRDYLVDQHVRRDVFVKGPQRLSRLEQLDAIRSDAFALATHPDDVGMKVRGELGETILAEQVYRPLIDVLAENDYAPKKVDDLVRHAHLKAIPLGQVLQAILVLVGVGHVRPAQGGTGAARTNCRALNRHLCERAQSNRDIKWLASPVTGGGVPASRFQQLFLLAMQLGKKSEAEQAAFAWACLSRQGRRLTKDGKVIESAGENIAELTKMADQFATKRLPVLRALEVV